jgi:hypothetical protein
MSPQLQNAIGLGSSLSNMGLSNLGLGLPSNLTLNDLGLGNINIDPNMLAGLGIQNLGGLGNLSGIAQNLPQIPGLENLGSLAGLGGLGGLGGVLGGEQPIILPEAAIQAGLTAHCQPMTSLCGPRHHAKTINTIETHFREKRHELQDWMLDDLTKKDMEKALRAMTDQWNSGEGEIATKAATTADAVATAKTTDTVNAGAAAIAIETSDLDGLCRASDNRDNLPQVIYGTRERGRSLFNTVNANMQGMPGAPSSRGAINQSLDMLAEMQRRYCNPSELGGLVGPTCDTISASADISFDLAARSGDADTMAAFIQNATNIVSPETFSQAQANLPEVLGYRGMIQNINEYNGLAVDSLSNALALSGASGEPISKNLQTTLLNSGMPQTALENLTQPDNVSPTEYLRLLALSGTAPEPLTEDLIANRAALEQRNAMNASSESMFLTMLDSSLQRENRNMAAMVGLITRMRTEAANADMLRVSETEAGSE